MVATCLTKFVVFLQYSGFLRNIASSDPENCIVKEWLLKGVLVLAEQVEEEKEVQKGNVFLGAKCISEMGEAWHGR